MILFESNCIILHHNTLIKTVMIININASKIITFESDCLLFKISIDANNEDPDQTAP